MQKLNELDVKIMLDTDIKVEDFMIKILEVVGDNVQFVKRASFNGSGIFNVDQGGFVRPKQIIGEVKACRYVDGLKVKYNVTKVEDGSRVCDCFVLRPQKDIAARKALLAYADATDNKKLKDDIEIWIDDINNDYELNKM